MLLQINQMKQIVVDDIRQEVTGALFLHDLRELLCGPKSYMADV